jgi:hypothetical protein
MAGIEASMTFGGIADGGTSFFARGVRHSRSDTIGVMTYFVGAFNTQMLSLSQSG